MEPDWPNEIYAGFKRADIRQVSYGPEAGQARRIRCWLHDAAIATGALTTEEEGVALAAGAWLGGQRSALLMQSSGTGNCINMLSLVKACRMPLLMVVTMRGEWGEFNPWQIPMGSITRPALELAGLLIYPVDAAADVGPTVEAAARIAFDSSVGVAIILSQKLIGFKSWLK